MKSDDVSAIDRAAEKAAFNTNDADLARETYKAATAGKLFASQALGEARIARTLSALALVGIAIALLTMWAG